MHIYTYFYSIIFKNWYRDENIQLHELDICLCGVCLSGEGLFCSARPGDGVLCFCGDDPWPSATGGCNLWSLTDAAAAATGAAEPPAGALGGPDPPVGIGPKPVSEIHLAILLLKQFTNNVIVVY